MTPRRSGRGDGGFTLIEMIVVIAVMAMIGGLVMMRQPWRSTGLNMDTTERALASALRLARSRAIAQDRAVSVATGARGFSVDGAAPWILPSDEIMSESRIVFLPDGGSSGGTILLGSKARRVAITVNWLTGRVRASEAAAP